MLELKRSERNKEERRKKERKVGELATGLSSAVDGSRPTAYFYFLL